MPTNDILRFAMEGERLLAIHVGGSAQQSIEVLGISRTPQRQIARDRLVNAFTIILLEYSVTSDAASGTYESPVARKGSPQASVCFGLSNADWGKTTNAIAGSPVFELANIIEKAIHTHTPYKKTAFYVTIDKAILPVDRIAFYAGAKKLTAKERRTLLISLKANWLKFEDKQPRAELAAPAVVPIITDHKLAEDIRLTRAAVQKMSQQQERLRQILKLINRHTGSSFSGFNRNSQLGDILNFVVEPMTEMRRRKTLELGPTLSVANIANALYRKLWRCGPNKVVPYPNRELRLLKAYDHAYAQVGMENLALFRFSEDSEYEYVTACISRADREFNETECSALQAICEAFESEITRLQHDHELLKNAAEHATATLVLDATFHFEEITPYTSIFVSRFFGSFPTEPKTIPQSLLFRIQDAIAPKTRKGLSGGQHHTFHAHEDGLLLDGEVLQKHGRFIVNFGLNDARIAELTRIRIECARFGEAGAMIFDACCALLDAPRGSSATEYLKNTFPEISDQAISAAERIVCNFAR